MLAADPGVSKSELARRVGVSRTTLAYYLRSMPIEVQAAQGATAETRRKVALDHFDLLDRIAAAADDVREVIADLRKQPTTPATAGAIFAGHRTAERLWRLLGELLGQVAPPTTNIYLTRVEALLSGPVDRASLSPTLRSALEEVRPDGPTR
ncbi:MAG: winged helix-turn-helix transcriptional regulator [Deltaproteobacteria bacterium]|nr:winged helix-turn-helix transcriptional regulator [Deltaproteobacteria bacterium]